MTNHQPDRRVGGLTNAERAKDGGDALLAFAKSQYPEGSEEITTAVGDLICSLLHYLASMGFQDPVTEMHDALERGKNYYRDETVRESHETDDGEWADEEPPFLEEPLYDPSEWMIHQGVAK